ncbi:FkbM family methyltransferase [Aminipila terrae]|uniref:FkbM family methyltransferase n=1 Tax=Aminipila terrae TaxID=2697030 RepID=A0A6P1MK98_9FIRM|nr:FkbM family methyltransferase [Aminipila terrae]QHI72056.1 FkbM family methyltransferase [Aminipila terrae]
MNQYNNIEIFNNAVWNKNDILYFLEAGTMGSTINNLGNVKVQAVNLDSVLEEKEDISFIKMDVEGAELEALEGAKNTIQQFKPKLAICVYHKVEHHWEIPLYIKNLNPKYKIFMRHHNLMGIETVCYAVNSEE